MVAAVEMTESRLVAGGEVGGGERGLDDADVATAKATAAVEVLLLDQHRQLLVAQQEANLLDNLITPLYHRFLYR